MAGKIKRMGPEVKGERHEKTESRLLPLIVGRAKKKGSVKDKGTSSKDGGARVEIHRTRLHQCS